MYSFPTAQRSGASISNYSNDVEVTGPMGPLGKFQATGSSNVSELQLSREFPIADRCTNRWAGWRFPSPRKISLTHSLSISLSHLLRSEGSGAQNWLRASCPGSHTLRMQHLFQEVNVKPPTIPNPLDDRSSKKKKSLLK